MARQWLGPATFLFIPLVVTDTPGYQAPPPDYRELVRRRVYYDPAPATGEDRSLASYIAAISYGRAALDATVSQPVTLRGLTDEDNPTLLAIQAQPSAHLFEYIAVVYPPNTRGAGSGMAQPGRIDFDPPRTPNYTRARSRFRHDAPIGTWAMEVIHNVTDIGDYYNGVTHPGRFEEMAAAAATHPTSYTKLEAGWLMPEEAPVHGGGTRRYTLGALGLPQPATGGRVAGVRVKAFGSPRHLVVEARLRSDRWDRGVDGTSGIPSEGVVLYEFSPETSSWPRRDANGPWPPLELRSPMALTVGQSFQYAPGRTNVRVVSATAGGFVTEMVTDDVAVPFVTELPAATATTRIQAAGLTPRSTGETGAQAWVWRQSPLGGTRVLPGSVVTLQLRTGPIP